MALELSEAVKQINALGNDFTEAELRGYGETVGRHIRLEDDALEGVAGGVNRGVDDFVPVESIATIAAKYDMTEQAFGNLLPVFSISYGISWGNINVVSIRGQQ